MWPIHTSKTQNPLGYLDTDETNQSLMIRCATLELVFAASGVAEWYSDLIQISGSDMEILVLKNESWATFKE